MAATNEDKGQMGVDESLAPNNPSHKATHEGHQLSSAKEYKTAQQHIGKGCGTLLVFFCLLSYKEIHFYFTFTPFLK